MHSDRDSTVAIVPAEEGAANWKDNSMAKAVYLDTLKLACLAKQRCRRSSVKSRQLLAATLCESWSTPQFPTKATKQKVSRMRVVKTPQRP